jgi:hypothetical protein
MNSLQKLTYSCALLAVSGFACADDPVTTAVAAPDKSAVSSSVFVSPELKRKARSNGVHIETVNGGLMFCWEDATLGTRLKTKKCVDEATFDVLLQQRGTLRDNLRQGTPSCNGSICGQIH